MKKSGGMCSRLYIVEDISSNNNDSDNCDNDDELVKKFLIRLYGGKVIGGDESKYLTLDRSTQILIYYLCGEIGCGPKIYGSFNGGRLEEFIPCRLMVTDDLNNSTLRQNFASKLARIHNLKLPITSKILDTLEMAKESLKLFDTADGHEYHQKLAAQMGPLDISYIFEFDWRSAIEWMIDVGKKFETRHVLCTNDMNIANALIRDKPDKFGEYVTLVDYELASMNPRGIDLGNHFLFHTIDVNSPTFLSGIDYPSEDLRQKIIGEYLEQSKIFHNGSDWDENGIDSIEHVLLEAEHGCLQKTLFFLGFMLEPKDETNPMSTDVEMMYKFYVSILK